MRTPILKNLGVSYLLAGVAFLILVLRVGTPHHRWIALTIYGISWIPFVFSIPRRRALVRLHRMKWGGKLKTYFPHFIMACLLGAFAYAARVLVPVEHTNLTVVSEGELTRNLKDDAASARYLNAAMNGLLAKSDASKLLTRSVADLTPEQKLEVRQLWSDFLQAGLELDFLQKEYKGFYQIDYVARPETHALAFLNAYYAYVCIYRSSLGMVLPTKGNASMNTLINEKDVVRGVPENSLFDLNQHLTHGDTMLRLNAGRAYLQFLKKDLVGREEMLGELNDNLRAIDDGLGKNLDMFFNNPLEALEHHAFKAWFPVQKEIAIQMSYVRTKDRNYFIRPAQLEVMRESLQPGDIIMERRNWHITNVGIPGFWPHLAIYTGNMAEMDAYFADVQTGGLTFSEAVKSLHPEVYAAYERGDDQRVIEAKRDGVIVQSLEESGDCDYLAVLRPRVSKQETMNAVLNAFKHYGKPYDYNFDFATDAALVCSELVYKAYLGCEGFQMEPSQLNGRLLYPPNDLVKKFDTQLGQKEPELGFVYFLDGSESGNVAVIRDAEALRKTWQRVKWDVMQE